MELAPREAANRDRRSVAALFLISAHVASEFRVRRGLNMYLRHKRTLVICHKSEYYFARIKLQI